MRRAPPGWLADRVDFVLLLALIVASASGLGILVGGGGPKEGLHFLYAVLAIGILPVAGYLTRRMQPVARASATILAALVVLVIVVRLFQTG